VDEIRGEAGGHRRRREAKCRSHDFALAGFPKQSFSGVWLALVAVIERMFDTL
jgi:hypothetical protein